MFLNFCQQLNILIACPDYMFLFVYSIVKINRTWLRSKVYLSTIRRNLN